MARPSFMPLASDGFGSPGVASPSSDASADDFQVSLPPSLPPSLPCLPLPRTPSLALSLSLHAPRALTQDAGSDGGGFRLGQSVGVANMHSAGDAEGDDDEGHGDPLSPPAWGSFPQDPFGGGHSAAGAPAAPSVGTPVMVALRCTASLAPTPGYPATVSIGLASLSPLAQCPSPRLLGRCE